MQRFLPDFHDIITHFNCHDITLRPDLLYQHKFIDLSIVSFALHGDHLKMDFKARKWNVLSRNCGLESIWICMLLYRDCGHGIMYGRINRWGFISL